MNYTNTNNKMTTVSKSDIKSIEKKCKMMIGDRYGENNEGGYGVSVKKTSFRNRKGKSVYSIIMIRIGNNIIENVTSFGCSYNEKLLDRYSNDLITKMNVVKNNF